MWGSAPRPAKGLAPFGIPLFFTKQWDSKGRQPFSGATQSPKLNAYIFLIDVVDLLQTIGTGEYVVEEVSDISDGDWAV